MTGSSRGIGRSIAETLADEAAISVLTGRDQALLDETAAAIRGKGRKAVIVNIDLREERAPAIRSSMRCSARLGRLTCCVNNAGTTKRGDFFELTDADWQDGYALKFFAHVRLTRAAWPLLQARRGSLITIGGSSGRKPAGRLHHRQLGQCRRARPSARRWRIAARTTACRSTASIRALSRPSANGAASGPRWSAAATARTTCVRGSCAKPASSRFGKVEDVADLDRVPGVGARHLDAWRHHRSRRRRDCGVVTLSTACKTWLS